MNYRIEQLRFLLREDPSSRVFYQLAELLRKEGEHSEAAEVLREGLERHPRYVAAWVSLGRAHLELNATSQAEGAFTKALDLDPQNAVAARMLGEIAIMFRDWPRAAKAFRLARELAPSDLAIADKIAFVEARIAGAGIAVADLDQAASRDTVAIRVPDVIKLSKEEPFSVTTGGDTGVWRSTQEVFAEAEARAQAEAEAEAEIPSSEAEARARGEAEADVQASTGADAETDAEDWTRGEAETAAEDSTRGDAEIEAEAEASTPEPELELEPTAAVETPPPHEPSPPPEPETSPGMEIELDEGMEFAPEEALDLAREPVLPSLPEPEPEPEPELAADVALEPVPPSEPAIEAPEIPSEQLPLPTMTLARLAIEQEDYELAENTLISLLERDPQHPEAGGLLNEVRRLRRPPEPAELVGLKVAVLRSWLDRVKLSAEGQMQ